MALQTLSVIATSRELERSPARRRQLGLSLADIQELRRLSRKLTRAFLKTVKQPGSA